jgi:N-methylhydantoinase A
MPGSENRTAGEAPPVAAVDVGGTHTDALVWDGQTLVRGKALTTPEDFSLGVLGALENAASKLDVDIETLLGRMHRFVNGTTIVTNALTELRGARVGAVVTRGFRDMFRIANGPRQNFYDDHRQLNSPDIVLPECIAEVTERVDFSGRVLIPLDEGDAIAAIDRLVEEQEIEALAVGFLWSFKTPDNEVRMRELVTSRHPDLPVFLSHDVYPMLGAYERWMTTVLNAFVSSRTNEYMEMVERRLAERGLPDGTLAYLHGLGGIVNRGEVERAPLVLWQSGPAGGVSGTNSLGKTMGVPNLIAADMGGTSLDVSVIPDNTISIERHRTLTPWDVQTGVSLVDVVSIGAGGGSIAWIDSRGVPQVGPRSAGSEPGPACYDRGGEDATVTDALVAMGFIDPERYLGGRVTLRRDLATEALERFGEPFDWSAEEAARSIHDLVSTSMALALHEVSVRRGHDPLEFAMVAFGGTLPLFAATIARRADIPRVLIPRHSAVFSAWGLMIGDHHRRYERAMGWETGDLDSLPLVNSTLSSMEEAARADLAAEGFGEDQIRLERTGTLQFQGQVWQLPMALPGGEIDAAAAARLAADFPAVYERSYGAGTAWEGTPVVLVDVAVDAFGIEPKPTLPRSTLNGAGVKPARSRPIFLPETGEFAEVPIFEDTVVTPGAGLDGPCVIEADDTTIYVPRGSSVARDERWNLEMSIDLELR